MRSPAIFNDGNAGIAGIAGIAQSAYDTNRTPDRGSVNVGAQIMKSVDLFVIGGGSGGVRAARIAASYGAKVALAEEYRMGGTCVIRGCVPKKLMVMASRFGNEFEASVGFGWQANEARFSWPTLMSRVHAEVTRLEGIYTSNLTKAGVEIHACRARILDRHTVELLPVLTDGSPSSGARPNGETEKISAKTILIATGSRPSMPDDIPGAALASSSNEFFLWSELPKRVLVQGAGYIALELACLLQRLGAEVTLVMRGQHVLRGFDQQVRELIQQQLISDGLKIKADTTLLSLRSVNGNTLEVALSDGTMQVVDRVLRATGRQPNTAGLGLDSLGISLDDAGAIPVDDFSQTLVSNVFAVGDVTNRVNLTPAAIREGHAFADSVFGNKPRAAKLDLAPSAVFTTPEIGTVGLTEEAARQSHPHIDIYSTRFRPMKVAMAGHTTQCFMKIIVDKVTDRVLGVHIIGPEAGELIQLVGIAVQMKASKADFDATLAVHPTISEELVTMRHAQT
jgi:glutathione reductase (NADPH)